MSEVVYEIQIPGCTKCNRGPDSVGTVRFDTEAAAMMQAAGFLDWEIWRAKKAPEVAEHFQSIWTKTNRDAEKYVSLAPTSSNHRRSDAWWLYGATMEALARIIKMCEENPHGFVKAKS